MARSFTANRQSNFVQQTANVNQGERGMDHIMWHNRFRVRESPWTSAYLPGLSFF